MLPFSFDNDAYDKQQHVNCIVNAHKSKCNSKLKALHTGTQLYLGVSWVRSMMLVLDLFLKESLRTFLVLVLETYVPGLEGQVLDTKSLVLSLKVTFVWVSELRWKLAWCCFCFIITVLVLVLYTLSYIDFDPVDLPFDKVCHMPRSIQPILSLTGAHFCTPATSAPVSAFSLSQWWRAMPVSSHFVSADWKLLVMERFKHNDRSDIL